MSYYPSVDSHSSHQSHQSVVYPNNRNSGYYNGYPGSYSDEAGHYPTSQPYYSPNNHYSRFGYYPTPQPYYTPNTYYPQSGNVLYTPSRRHRSSRHHQQGAVYMPTDFSDPRIYRPYDNLGDRIMRFFGLRSRHSSSWSSRGRWRGIFGPNRNRLRFMDPRTGEEVDRWGRRVYRV